MTGQSHPFLWQIRQSRPGAGRGVWLKAIQTVWHSWDQKLPKLQLSPGWHGLLVRVCLQILPLTQEDPGLAWEEARQVLAVSACWVGPRGPRPDARAQPWI